MTEFMPKTRPGLPAPGFSLWAGPQEETSLGDYRGRPTILAFYPADWSPVCSSQMALYELAKPEFERHDAALLGISVDSIWSHQAFARENGISFPLLSDFEPKGEVSQRYGVFTPEGFAARALFLVDADGTIAWRYIGPINMNPGADIIIDALERLGEEQRMAGTRT